MKYTKRRHLRHQLIAFAVSAIRIASSIAGHNCRIDEIGSVQLVAQCQPSREEKKHKESG